LLVKRKKKKDKELELVLDKKRKRGKNIWNIIGLIGKLYNYIVYIYSLANYIKWFIKRTSKIVSFNNCIR
jgi:hypothetical protein